MKKFDKSERSAWRYYFAHWCAFQMVALNLGIWKFRYIFHDWYKPWLKMFGMQYKDIQKLHRYNSRHHIEYFESHCNPSLFDWDAMIIDWECSQYTKKARSRNAFEEMKYILETSNNHYLKYILKRFMEPRLKELELCN